MSVPNSFFWFMMDYVEFREDGTVWGLMDWPPDGGDEIRLNVTGAYFRRDDGTIEFVGTCRHEDPCTGTYEAVLKDDTLLLSSSEARLELERAGPPSQRPPPEVMGPSPSPTPQ